MKQTQVYQIYFIQSSSAFFFYVWVATKDFIELIAFQLKKGKHHEQQQNILTSLV